jgi:hypothetical protein
VYIATDETTQLLSLLCMRHNATLLCAFSWDEAARYIEALKMYEGKGPELIQEKTEEVCVWFVCAEQY